MPDEHANFIPPESQSKQPRLAEEDASRTRQRFDTLRAEVGRVIVGQHDLVEGLLIALLSGGHALVEGLPGVAKSTAVATLASAVDLSYRRIQFTPDLLPADITGAEVFRPQTGAFETRRGPIFTSVVLADEINRAPAKVQSALLEAMQERQVTIAGESIPLPDPFLVLATQNPIEEDGTYELPEAQTDRFLLKILVPYPSGADELEILNRAVATTPAAVQSVLSRDELMAAIASAKQVFLDDNLKAYLVRLVVATRDPESVSSSLADAIRTGVSPRATLGLAAAARAAALLDGRTFATPDDVKRVAFPVLRHRLALSYEALADRRTADSVVAELLETVPVP